MSYYKICPSCGAHLDANEACDCIGAKYQLLTEEEKRLVNEYVQSLLVEQRYQAAAM